MRWLTLCAFPLFAACISTTTISSRPPRANVWVDGQPLGEAPVQWSDTVWAGTKNQVRLSMPGYTDTITTIAADQWSVGRVVASVLCFLPGLLWSTDYRPYYDFILQPDGSQAFPGGAAPTAPQAYPPGYVMPPPPPPPPPPTGL